MVRAVQQSARLVASHSRGAAATLRETCPQRPIQYVALGEGPHNLDVVAARQRFRAAHDIDPTAVVFGVYGALTAEKRVPQVVQAFAATRAWVPDAILVLAGPLDPRLDLRGQIDGLGLAVAAHVIESLDDEAF